MATPCEQDLRFLRPLRFLRLALVTIPTVALTPGTRFGPYEVSAQIGAGGMGEVYEATDTNLGRRVAIKVLPDAVAADVDRLARFDREARALAALDHPNIAVIFGLERTSSTTALVMELVEGPTLAERIAQGPIPVDEALPIARQIAEALEAAHEQGIVHRDLKPANVKLRPDGRVKVLDFGLAKAVEPSAAMSPGLSVSPTITTPAMTQAGLILGTAAYMSPEQARGKSVDRRSDIWAFGCVLHEMLTGRRAFQSDEVSDTLAFVLTKEPDWSALPADTPPALVRLLRRCLVKDRGARLPDIGIARLEIDDARTELTSPRRESPTPPARTRTWVPALVAGAAIMAAIVAVALWMNARSAPLDRHVTRALIGVAPAERLLTGIFGDGSMGQGRPSRTAMAFTPDGRTLVFTAERDRRVQLYRRRLDQLEGTPIAGTDGASTPFFSPDGESLGFFADGALKRVPVAGGAVITIAPVGLVFGASWGPADQIAYAMQFGGLFGVAASGGKPTPITKLEADEYSHRLPQFLPDGKTVLFTSTKAVFPGWDDTRIVAQSLTTGARKVLIDGGADARYVPTGHLVYVRRGTLMAVPFDADRAEVTGKPVGLLEDVMQAARIQPVQIDSGAGQFAVSNSGSLAYVSGGIYRQDRWSLVWADRSGHVDPLQVPAGAYIAPRLSPDGKRVAFGTSSGDWDLAIYDVSRGLVAHLPMPEDQSVPVWTPDSSMVVFTSSLSDGGKLFIRRADGNGSPEPFAPASGWKPPPRGIPPFANSWTPDRSSLVMWAANGPSTGGLWVLPRQGTTAPRPLISDGESALEAEFSPDGKWVAYTSGTALGRNEVYVRPYPALDRRVQITGDNSHAPVWRNDGRELFYLEGPLPDDPVKVRVKAMPVTTTPTFSVGTPRTLFEGPFRVDGPFRGYDVTPDGQRFLMVRAVEQPPDRVTHMMLVQNWVEELKARVPSK
jgi:serine/threonine protein kinase/Tol biopolymer transport system component